MATKDANGDLHSENNGRFVSKEEQEAKREQAERIYNSEPEPIEKGKSESSENKKMTPAEKIASVHIDFDRDNILPELNDEDLEKIGLKENKSVLLKKSIIDRNIQRHNDAMPDTERIITQALYSPSEIFHGKNEKPYYTFVKPLKISKRNGKDEYGIVLLDVGEEKENFEIVHWHWVNEENLNSIKK